MKNVKMANAAIEMKQHKQNEQESLLDHGIAVAKALWRIRSVLEGGPATSDFIPDVVLANREFLLKET